jgi:PAS domain S-box-containing protein
LDLEVARSLADLVSVDAMVTEAGKIIYANPSLSRSCRTEMGWDQTEGHHVSDLFSAANKEAVREWYEELLARKDRFGVLELRPTDGEDATVGKTLTAIRLEDRELIVARARDDLPVMDRFRDLEVSSRIFRNYLRDGGLGLMILQDDEGRESIIRYISPEGAALLEREPSELTGLEVAGFVAAQDREALKDFVQARTDGTPAEGSQEIRFINPRGEELLLDSVMGVTIWEGKPAVYCLFRDVTERRIMIDELRRFEQAFEMLKDTLVLADGDFNIIYVNPTGLERSGYTFEEVSGEPVAMFASTADGTVDPLEEAVELLEKGQLLKETTAINKEGRKYPVEVSVTVSTDYKGDPEMVAIHSRDITERKEAERDILHARERAEFFTDLMAHDINNYIQGVIGFLDLLEKSELDGEQALHVSQANEQASRVSSLIERVRTISMAQHPEELKPIDVKAVIDEAMVDVRQKYSDRELDLRLTEPEGPVVVHADDLLSDMALNLLDNAVKFCTDDKVVVDVGIEHLADRELVALSVADRGPGIPDEDKEEVFFRFVRRREEPEGTGLGLSLVMALAERYKGHVWVEDRVEGKTDEGTRFVVELPTK